VDERGDGDTSDEEPHNLVALDVAEPGIEAGTELAEKARIDRRVPLDHGDQRIEPTLDHRTGLIDTGELLIEFVVR
jgi:hypothetical protein